MKRYRPPGHASIWTTLHALAELLRAEGRFREAEPLYGRATEIREKVTVTNPRPFAETLHDFSELLRRTGRSAKAARLDALAAALVPPK